MHSPLPTRPPVISPSRAPRADHDAPNRGSPPAQSTRPPLPSPPLGDEPGRDPLDFPPEPSNQRGIVLGVCVMGAGLAICGIGLIINTLAGNRPPPPAPARPSPVVAAVAEQAAVVREALHTARQTRDLQRERVEALQREMAQGEQSSAGVLPVGLGK